MTLYGYPPASAFGHIVPKDKIYTHGAASPALRERFVDQVAQIRWKHKLAPETINVNSTPQVPEIEVFSVVLKEEALSPQVLACIDKAIPLPILYELQYEDRLRLAAAPRVLCAGKPLMGGYVFSEWMPASAPRIPLPVTLDLNSLYAILLTPLVPCRQRPQEPLEDWIRRLNQIQKAQQTVAALENRLHREKQFNRQIPINRELRTARQHLAALCRE